MRAVDGVFDAPPLHSVRSGFIVVLSRHVVVVFVVVFFGSENVGDAGFGGHAHECVAFLEAFLFQLCW